MLVLIAGLAMMGWAWCGGGGRAILWGVPLLLAGSAAAASLAGSLETWGTPGYIPGIDFFRIDLPDPIPLWRPRAPGPLRGWTWGEHIRKAACPLCAGVGAPEAPQPRAQAMAAFYE